MIAIDLPSIGAMAVNSAVLIVPDVAFYQANPDVDYDLDYKEEIEYKAARV